MGVISSAVWLLVSLPKPMAIAASPEVGLSLLDMLVGRFCNPVYWDWAFFVGPGLSVDKLKRMNSHSPKKQNRFQAYRFDNFSKYQGRTYQTSFAHVRILADGKLAAKHL